MSIANIPCAKDKELFDAMRVSIPEADSCGMRVVKFEVRDIDNIIFGYYENGRASRPGVYTRLEELVHPDQADWQKTKWHLWMTDTEAERLDHMPFLRMADLGRARRLLINGLGLGMVIKAALTLPDTESIDVVEMDERVIHLVGPSYDDYRVHIHHMDAIVQARRWPRNTRWDVAWHDIWPDGDPEHKDQMTFLMRSYARRVRWQGAWAHDSILGKD